MLQDEDELIKKAAIDFLSMVPDPRGVAPLIVLLDDLEALISKLKDKNPQN